MISKYITENGKFRQIDEFMPGTWINLTAPTQDESLEIARRYNVDLADIRAALDDEESSRVDVNDDYVLILFDIPSVEIRHNQEAYTTIPLGVVWTDDAIITVCSAETPVLKHFIVNNIRDFTTKKQVRFTYQIMYRTSMLYQSYLRIIDRRRLEMEERMGGATEDADIVNLHEMESNLVYFDTSLRANRMVVDRLTRYSGIRKFPEDQELLDELVGLIVETLCDKAQVIRIGSHDYPAALVQERMRQIDSFCLEYVCACLRKSNPSIRNIKQYLLMALFNAPVTMSHYYYNKAQNALNDWYTGGIANEN